MIKSSADEIAAAMAQYLNNSKDIVATINFTAQKIIKIADELDNAGFLQIAEILDNALHQIASITKNASTYDDFLQQLAGVATGDCKAIKGIYNRFVAQLEGEGTFMRARQDCLAKCPSFRPE